mmetsp:Transcript_19211/g.49579  ORF Transcript_19211/g.49579 Transcript_19211/m.49579 type:complete len:264 (+) Transcript_19211:318-1109(+)
MLSSNWMPTSSSSSKHPNWRRCSPCTRLEPLPCSSTCLTRSTNRDSKMCCAPRVCRATFPCRTSPVPSTRRCATVGATTSVWRCSTSSSEVRTYAFAPLLASGSLRISSFLICLRFRQSGSTVGGSRNQTSLRRRTISRRSKEIGAWMPGSPMRDTSKNMAASRPHQVSCTAHILSLPCPRPLRRRTIRKQSKEICARIQRSQLTDTREVIPASRPHQVSCVAHLLSLPRPWLYQISRRGQIVRTSSRLHLQSHQFPWPVLSC